ncbi:peptidyl-tRNA hydrolase 2, mitochondrial-like [Babylonia areolata]|uniref:peptidyl-tRNA hydrolase 2, mitochondrial-like n=1 Tax=Babylonia areolata TaxID=304850 RepID=UPI003FD22004
MLVSDRTLIKYTTRMLEVDRATLMVSATLSVGLGIAIGWALRGRAISGKLIKKGMVKDLTDGIQAMADNGEIKLILVVNNELKMGKGKIAAQCAHAAVGVVERAFHQDPDTFRQWRLHGQPKVVVRADSTAMLKELGSKAQSLGLVTCLISDAGRTQIAPGSKTVLGVGPGPASLVDQVTGHLKLL